MSHGPLKLAATDPDDISVLSALLQDSIIPVSEMIYLVTECRFVLVANRFRWEESNYAKMSGISFERVRCGVSFDRVNKVYRRNIDLRDQSRELDLLALEATSEYVDLIFAGNAAIRLHVERILCHAEDFGETWQTQLRPEHELGDATEN